MLSRASARAGREREFVGSECRAIVGNADGGVLEDGRYTAVGGGVAAPERTADMLDEGRTADSDIRAARPKVLYSSSGVGRTPGAVGGLSCRARPWLLPLSLKPAPGLGDGRGGGERCGDGGREYTGGGGSAFRANTGTVAERVRTATAGGADVDKALNSSLGMMGWPSTRVAEGVVVGLWYGPAGEAGKAGVLVLVVTVAIVSFVVWG